MSTLLQPVLVSILLAARNEEDNIGRCLRSLNELQYPKENLEICIGDDDSNDRTADIIKDYIKDKPHFKYFRISEQTAGLKGKANVLAQLAHKTSGQYLFFCDADITVPDGWIGKMLTLFKENMNKSHLFADFLSLEWLFTLTIMRFFSLFNRGITGMGNNMAVTREAYHAVGGYESIGFSIVEDYALFMAITKKNFGFVQSYIPGVLAVSEPVYSFKELVVQRKRWMHGIMKSPLILRICLIISALLIPAIAIIAIWDPERSLHMVIQNYLLITAIVMVPLVVLKQKDLWKTVFFFWFYLIGISILMLIIHLSPGKTSWKERTY
jgi:cellulose synthase/poly-beta-1,6-N-acetylglucosamine synthase-like glycosyltransferase